MTNRPTAAQRRVLLNLANGRDPAEHIGGRSEHGGFVGTFWSLVRRGWIGRDFRLTPAGRELAEALGKEGAR